MMKKRLLSLCLVLALALSLFSVPAAASGSSPESAMHADQLRSLRLFQGTGGGYQLDDTATRLHGLIMLIRLLGLEEEAKAYNGSSPFTDTRSPYVGYAYAKGLIRGVTAAAFHPNDPLSARSYLSFLFRALGYDDSQGDFTADNVLTFAHSISLISGDAIAPLTSLTLNRGDLVDLSYAALTCKMKDGDRTLAEKLRDDGVFTQADGEEASVLGRRSGWIYTYALYTPKPDTGGTPAGNKSGIRYAKQTVSVSGGSVTAHVVTVDPRKTAVRASLVNKSVGNTDTFFNIVHNSGAAVVVNGNFFNAQDTFKTPIGNVMMDGELLYASGPASSTLTSFGFTRDGQIKVGRPAVQAQVRCGEDVWTADAVNVPAQSGTVLYTPAYGPLVVIRKNGFVMTVQNSTIIAYSPVTSSSVLSIPNGGFLLYMDSDYAASPSFRRPPVRRPVTLEYGLSAQDSEGFTMDGVTNMISGGPRLVKDGAAVTTLEPEFQEEPFTSAASARTAMGVNDQGQLILVSVPAATIQQMRELMLSLGCVDAVNLDGGTSAGMYCGGTYLVKPARALTVTLQVYSLK